MGLGCKDVTAPVDGQLCKLFADAVHQLAYKAALMKANCAPTTLAGYVNQHLKTRDASQNCVVVYAALHFLEG